MLGHGLHALQSGPERQQAHRERYLGLLHVVLPQVVVLELQGVGHVAPQGSIDGHHDGPALPVAVALDAGFALGALFPANFAVGVLVQLLVVVVVVAEPRAPAQFALGGVLQGMRWFFELQGLVGEVDGGGGRGSWQEALDLDLGLDLPLVGVDSKTLAHPAIGLLVPVVAVVVVVGGEDIAVVLVGGVLGLFLAVGEKVVVRACTGVAGAAGGLVLGVVVEGGRGLGVLGVVLGDGGVGDEGGGRVFLG